MGLNTSSSTRVTTHVPTMHVAVDIHVPGRGFSVVESLELSTVLPNHSCIIVCSLLVHNHHRVGVNNNKGHHGMKYFQCYEQPLSLKREYSWGTVHMNNGMEKY